MRLKAATDFATQQAGLAARNVDSAKLTAFESATKKDESAIQRIGPPD